MLRFGFNTLATQWIWPVDCGDIAMAPSSSYRNDLLNYIEVLGAQTRLLQIYFAGQKAFVRSHYYMELECVRSRFAEFRRLLEQTDIEDDVQLNQQMEAIESARERLVSALDSLIEELRRTHKTRCFFGETVSDLLQ